MWLTVSLPNRTLPAFISGMAVFGQPTQTCSHKRWPSCAWNGSVPGADHWPLCLSSVAIFSLHPVTPGTGDFLFHPPSEWK